MVDELDPVPVGIGYEADPILLSPPRRVRRPIGLDARLRQRGQQAVEVVHHEGHVVVAIAEVVGFVAADVHRQLQHVAVAKEAQVDVVGRLEVQAATRLEAEPAVELH